MLASPFAATFGPRLLRYALIGTLATPAVSPYLEMELVGQGQGWTDLTPDVAWTGFDIDRGLPGNTAVDRVAKTGTFKFELRNDANTSGGAVGFYSPDNANCRPGFAYGINVRLRMNVLGEMFSLFHGELDEIDPMPGLFDGLRVSCVAVDWMDRAARAPLAGLQTLLNTRSDQVFSALVAASARQPAAIQVMTGLDTYPFALDNTSDETARIMTEMQRLAMSELGLIYHRNDGTLVFENRKFRPTSTGNTDVFLATELRALKPTRARASMLNRVRTTLYPRRTDASNTTVLYSLQVAGGNQQAVGPGSTVIVGPCPYRDPTNQAARIGATAQIPPVAGTDYALNSAIDVNGVGIGTDLTAAATVTAAFGGNSVTFTVVNHSTSSAFFTLLQCRGKGIYAYNTTLAEAIDQQSRDINGENLLQIDMPYQNDPAVGGEVAQYLVNTLRFGSTIPESEIVADAYNPTLMARALRRDISDRIGLVESVTGFAGKSFFVNAVRLHIDDQLTVTCNWTLVPADTTAYWLLEVVGRSELDQTTVLGYGLIVGHIDVAHADAHADTAHGDVGHGDSNHVDAAHADQHNDAGHADSVHVDSAHVDSPHADGHSDAAHADTSHSDVAHGDSHSDSPHNDSHADTTHVDAHDDTHTDQAHFDSAHTDVAHADDFVPTHTDDGGDPSQPPNHTDAFGLHEDSAHFDNAHGDVAHGDVGHTDSHADVSHVDTHVDHAHADATSATPHSDVAHVDGAHSDSHGDAAHVDTAHVDTAHGDGGHADSHDDTVHGDTVHSDSPHTDGVHVDTHGDTAHGDS